MIVLRIIFILLGFYLHKLDSINTKRSFQVMSVPISASLPDISSDYNYQFIDCGNSMRLERFGKYIVRRSCPSAAKIRRRHSDLVWSAADIIYEGKSGEKGQWTINNENVIISDDKIVDWYIKWNNIAMKLDTYDMGQVGVFPEQFQNWRWIRDCLKITNVYPSDTNHEVSFRNISILNSFSYTGGSTFATLTQPNILTTNLDASSTCTQLARSNYLASDLLGNVRWIEDNCLTFLKRAQRRGEKFDGLIFDPPAFGRLTSKKIWKLDRDLPILFEMIPSLLSDNPSFILISCHDPEWPAEKLGKMLHSFLPPKLHRIGKIWYGDLKLDASPWGQHSLIGNSLTLGTAVRWQRF